MSDVFEYKGYCGSIEVSIEDNCLHGKILHIRDLVSYEAEALPDLRTQFNAAVDNYIESCARLGVEPKKPCSGTFNIRIGPALHLQAVEEATRRRISLNDYVKSAIEAYPKNDGKEFIHHHYHFAYRQQIPLAQDQNFTFDYGDFTLDKVGAHQQRAGWN